MTSRASAKRRKLVILSGAPQARSRRTERDYAHRTLFDKLGVKTESRVALVGKHDDEFVAGLNSLLAKRAASGARGTYDLIFLRVDKMRDLARIPSLIQHLESKGGLWIVHPKGRGASPADAEVRAAALATGLVDNKISAYSNSHTMSRYVIRVARRRN